MIALLLWLAAARAEEPAGAGAPGEAGQGAEPATGQPEPGGPTQRERLDQAVAVYLQGDVAGARSQLQALLGEGPTLSAEIRQEALVWLGDILYSEEGEGAARTVFLALIASDPAYVMDSFRHPPEVVRYFEALKAANRPPDPDPLIVEARPWPVTTLVPGGYYYYRQGRPGVGAALTTLQVGTLAASTVLYLELKGIPQELEPGQESEVARARALRTADWVIGVGGWLCFAVPVVYETARWNRELRLQAGAGGVQIEGTF